MGGQQGGNPNQQKAHVTGWWRLPSGQLKKYEGGQYVVTGSVFVGVTPPSN